jgi:hypothetical protein
MNDAQDLLAGAREQQEEHPAIGKTDAGCTSLASTSVVKALWPQALSGDQA